MDNSLVELLKALGRPIDVGCTLIENLLSEPTKKLGGIIGDQISYWQWSNRLNMVEMAAEKLRRKGLSVHRLPNDFVIPLLRECGDAEDPELQEWWADMLASAIEDESNCHVGFVHVLHSMSATDVKVLDSMLSLQWAEREGRAQAIAESSGLTDRQVTVSMHNLERLGFFTPTGRRLKGFAYDLLRACYPYPDRIEAFKEKESKLPRVIVSD